MTNFFKKINGQEKGCAEDISEMWEVKADSKFAGETEMNVNISTSSGNYQNQHR